MLLRWIPWKFLIRRAARAYDIVDPLTVIAHVRRFSQPSEVQEPIELVRAGIVFQARGLVNTRVFQFNMDWVWPHWVVKQFNPRDASFIPRAHSFSHVNLTQRNWTAVGLPDVPLYPLVDPRGMVTPLHNGWSLDFWIIPAKGEHLLPSRLDGVEQRVRFEPTLAVTTCARAGDLALRSEVSLALENDRPWLQIRLDGAGGRGWLVAAVRPCNPEGIQFVESIAFDPDVPAWRVDGRTPVHFSERPAKVLFSEYSHGDVYHRHSEAESDHATTCKLGLATAAAFFPLTAESGREVALRVPLQEQLDDAHAGWRPRGETWASVTDGTARLDVPDERVRYIYDAALHTLVLLSATDVFPGSFYYRRFWFRDACLMIHALLATGFGRRARRLLETFPARQRRDGYFKSQEGEWDSNGQVLWVLERFEALTGRDLDAPWEAVLERAATWIVRKRTSNHSGEPHAGLFPAGFSAEHLGPNDFYFWDDFWGIAGLRAAAGMLRRKGKPDAAASFERQAADFESAVQGAIAAIPARRSRGGIPASPYRRMDAGAIGSMVADYPLQLTPPADPRIAATLEHLLRRHMYGNGFFQDMIHSGINIYLTLALAQTLLRNGDPRYRDLMAEAAERASPTGLWPEAVHPFSGGGCMGDGQHGWAAAEWVMLIRNLFVREEGGRLVLGSGLLPEWLQAGRELSFGPAPTPYGDLTLAFVPVQGGLRCDLDPDWRDAPPELEIRVPGFQPQTLHEAPGAPIVLAPAAF